MENTKSVSEMLLPKAMIDSMLAMKGECCNQSKIFYYESLDDLVNTAGGSKNWSPGEIFAFAINEDEFVFMKQIAQSGCEMMVFTNNGFNDVFTAYRIKPDDFKKMILDHMLNGGSKVTIVDPKKKKKNQVSRDISI